MIVDKFGIILSRSSLIQTIKEKKNSCKSKTKGKDFKNVFSKHIQQVIKLGNGQN